MKETLGRRRAAGIAAAIAGISLAGLLAAGCKPRPFAPLPGLAEWRAPAALAVRDGLVDLPGGNLLLRHTDLSLATRLGPQAVTHIYSSATDRWRWSFEMTYADGVFTDDTGARHELAAAPAGPIAGTRWRKLDGATIETRGGLRFSFAPDGALAGVRWRHAPQPSLVLSRPGDGTLRIAQCTAPAACADAFVVHYAGAEVVAIDDRAGRRVRCGWSGGRLAWVETPFARENGLSPRRYHYALDANGRPATIVVENPERERVRYELDPAGRVTAWQAIGEESPRWGVAHGVQQAVVTDPLGRETELRFDAQRRLVERHERASGERTHLTWTGRRATRVVAPDGLATHAAYGAEDDLASLTLPSGRMLAFEPAPPGAVNLADPWATPTARVWDAGAVVVVRAFDAQGRVASETNGAGERTQFHYGPLETLARVELPAGAVVELAEYGEHGQPVELRIPAATPDGPAFVERRAFDAVGDMIRGSEPGSESGSQFPGVVARTFDAARRVRTLVMSQTNDGVAQDVVLVRRSDGRLRAIQRPYGADAEWEYDALGRLRAQRERVDGAWAETRYAWTPSGELARVESPNGTVQELSYDAAGRVVRRANRRGVALESEVAYAYEAGRLVRKDDTRAPGPTRVAYDAAGRVLGVTWPDGEQSWYGWDARDRLDTTTLVRADGQLLRQLGLRYDAAGRRTRLFDGAALVYEERWANGRLAAIRHGNGVERTLSYDEFGRLAGAVSRDAGGALRERETVERQGRDLGGPEPNGPFRETLARYQASAASGTVAFAERAIGFRFRDGERWIAPWIPDSGTVQWCNGACDVSTAQMPWSRLSGLMDADGETLPESTPDVTVERLWRKNPERNRLHAVAHRTTTASGHFEAVEHRYTWDAAGFATSRDGVPITWDATGQLASFGAATFARDGEGRLRGSLVAGVAMQRRFGGLVEADASGNAVRMDLGAVAIDLAASRRTYRHFDWRGNVRSVWDDEGRLRSVREYAAYGPARTHGESGDPRGFAQGLEVAGLVVLGGRVYDPAARQFLSPDPIYNAVHQFVYGAGDPANYWDWTGWNARETAGFRIAGGIGQLAGSTIAIGAAVLLIENPVTAAAALGVSSGPAGEFTRTLFEESYVFVYDWANAPPRPRYTPHAVHPHFVPRDFVPLVSGAPPPEVLCDGGECMVRYPFVDFPARPTGRPPAGALYFAPSFAPAGYGCGLLGAESLPLLAALAVSRRSRRRFVS